jgi:molybdopterin-guanine dinucleotide biosynthesis protein A
MTLTTMLMAGGQSRRMGFDKATLTIGGEPLWQRQLRVLAELKPAAVWVSARIKPPWCPAEIEVLLDAPPSRGPLSGLAAGLHRLETSHLLVLAIDLPNISAEHLRKLCSLIRPGCGVIPTNAGSFEPLSAIYPIESAPTVREALSSSNFSLQHIAKALVRQNRAEAYVVPAEERAFYLNLNRPSDVESFRA